MNEINTVINGVPAQQIDATDRGLHYGDGLFETLVIKQGQPQLWGLHLARLQRGCDVLDLPLDSALLEQEVKSLCKSVAHAVLKIIVTRGSGGRGYRPPQKPEHRRIISLHDIPDYPEHYWQKGVNVRWCDLRLAQQPKLAGIKHLNRLEQVMARQEWSHEDIVEGILSDQDGNVIEGIMSNLFLVKDSKLLTPDLSQCGVGGVMRQQLMVLATAAGIPVRVQNITESHVMQANEIFLTNSVIGIWPVRRLAQETFSVGAITTQLQQACAAYV